MSLTTTMLYQQPVESPSHQGQGRPLEESLLCVCNKGRTKVIITNTEAKETPVDKTNPVKIR